MHLFQLLDAHPGIDLGGIQLHMPQHQGGHGVPEQVTTASTLADVSFVDVVADQGRQSVGADGITISTQEESSFIPTTGQFWPCLIQVLIDPERCNLTPKSSGQKTAYTFCRS
ncbi:MAG: hypothetical protein GY712_03545 [Oceanicoccus sp.]|uniref:hypothetical protein n=1 Tax=Oceanicoccus sp. TaxID=2691044 RepID=UPI00260D9D3B|nr:hypothetical protein [Oceanicoccus sp.]MCP3907072.1 hypothetical protein [Oceanicoccus sp.]